MADFNEQLPQWDATGVEPPTSKKTAGWAVNDKIPAGWLNWLFNRIYKVMAEIRTVVSTHKSDNTTHITATERNTWNAKAPLASPALTGTPTAPTAAVGTNTTQLANTAFVEVVRASLAATDALKAPLVSPALTGTPTTSDSVDADNSAKIANTKFVKQTATRRINLRDQLQVTSYRRSVIALCDLTNTNPSARSYSNGILTMKRSNGLGGQVTAFVAAEKAYNAAAMNYHALRLGRNVARFRPCSFVYNGVKYGGIDLYITDAESQFVEFNGSTEFTIFGVDYYDTQNSVVLNAEINNSLSSVENTDFYYTSDINFNGAGINATTLGGAAAAAYALLDSPAFTGTPTAPTASAGANTTQIATTAFVAAALAGLSTNTPNQLADGISLNTVVNTGFYRLSASATNAPSGATNIGYAMLVVMRLNTTIVQLLMTTNGAKTQMFVRGGTPTDTGGSSSWRDWQESANLDSPAFTGVPTAPIAPTGTDTTQLAATGFVTRNFFRIGNISSTADDLNAVVTPGVYRLGSTHANGPAAYGYGQLLVLRGANTPDTITQMVFPYNNDSIAFRSSTVGAIASATWKYLWNSGNFDPTAIQQYKLTQASGKNIMLATGYDLNTLVLNGFYDVNQPVNGPTSSNWWHIIVQAHSGNNAAGEYVVQRATGLNTASEGEFIRRRVNGTWGDWREVVRHQVDNYKAPADLPSTYPNRMTTTFFVNNIAGWPALYGTVQTIKGFTNMAAVQYFYPYNVDAPIKYRYGLYNSDAWGAWRWLIDSTAVDVNSTANTSPVRDSNKKIAEVAAQRAIIKNMQLTTTSSTNILTTTVPAATTMYTIKASVRTTAATSVAIAVTYTNVAGTVVSESITVDTTQLSASGNYYYVPVTLVAAGSSTITVSARATVINTVFISAVITEEG